MESSENTLTALQPARKPYASPRLEVHGSVEKLTQKFPRVSGDELGPAGTFDADDV